MIVVTLLVIAILILAVGVIYLDILHKEAKRQANKYKVRWHFAESTLGAEEALIYEWSNRDLMPEWENVYPHVRNMDKRRKYSEWATFCGNYPTRQQLIAQLSLDGAYHRARAER